MSTEQKTPYRVLARKYRPRNFDELIGQDALVRTLRNAIQSGRIAQAYMLTGVRGVGKTTTARIIARALNYTGKDGKSGPTTGPTDDCATCQAIAEGRHPDVLEIDAASHNGVDNIRDLTDGVRYAPTSARYKVYIVDEVHMLSTAAFNALLKTLEEPPPHVIFIFATTEIRKVPVTVLSRCQRFDLRRVDVDTLGTHYKSICAKEGVKAEDDAIAMISRAADGSVRDGLSILDQAIALSGDTGVTAQGVSDMLGLADRGRIVDLLDHALSGRCAEALTVMNDLYRAGASPDVVLNDMLDFVHALTRLRAAPELGGDFTPEMLARAKSMAQTLGMPALGRAWQILLKGIAEVAAAPQPQSAAEMIVIRLAYAADLPDPADLLKKIKKGEVVVSSAPAGAPTNGDGGRPQTLNVISGGGAVRAVAQPVAQPQAQPAKIIASVAQLEEALREAGHMILASNVYHHLHPLKIEHGRLEFQPGPQAQHTLANDLSKALFEVTGTRWAISVSNAKGAPSLAQEKEIAQKALVMELKKNPVVGKVLEIFPDAQVNVIKEKK